jgi:plastocyanin
MSEQPGTRSGAAGSGMILGLVAVAIAILALVLAGIALFQPGAAGQVPSPATETREFALSSDLVAESNRYHPATIVAFQGDDLVLHVTNRGEIDHGFKIDALDIEEILAPGDARDFTVSGVDAGVYRFYCHLHPGHIGGQLIVFDR